MKKILATVLVAILVLGLTGCDTQKVEYKGVSLKVPKTWERDENEFFVSFYDNGEEEEDPDMLSISAEESVPGVAWQSADSMMGSEIKYFSVEDTSNVKPIHDGQIKIDGIEARVLSAFIDFDSEDYPADGELDGYGISAWVIKNDTLYNIKYTRFPNPSGKIDDKKEFEKAAQEEFDKIIKTVKLK